MRHQPVFLLLILLLLSGCKEKRYTHTEITTQRIAIDASIDADTSFQNFIAPYSQHINKTLDSVLAYNPTDLSKTDGELNTAIGNLMADIVMEQASPVFYAQTGNRIDMVLLNHGGIRSTIGKGGVSARNAYNVMPFENEIVVAEITGEKIFEMLQYLLRNKTAHPLTGINIVVDQNFELISATINGSEISAEETYFVATSDYLQQGGDSMNFFKDPVTLHRVDYKIRNAIIDYLHKVDTLHTQRDTRYIQVKK